MVPITPAAEITSGEKEPCSTSCTRSSYINNDNNNNII